MSPEKTFGLRHLSIFILSTQGNVLISEQGTARLVDFGITDVLTNPILFEGQGLVWTRGLVRYVAPELIVPSNFGLDRAKPTKECDIHSFAMTIYEVCSFCIVYDHR